MRCFGKAPMYWMLVMSLCLSLWCGLALSEDSASTEKKPDFKSEMRNLPEGSYSNTISPKIDALGGCDGIKNGKYGFHTSYLGTPSWWQVDLGEDRALDRVLVYNRCDACPDRALSMMVRLSNDAREWTTAYKHDGSMFYGFSDGKPLNVAIKGATARYVRIELPNEGLHLDEIEVYPTYAPKKNIALNRPADQSSACAWSNMPEGIVSNHYSNWASTMSMGLQMPSDSEPDTSITVYSDSLLTSTPLASEPILVEALGPACAPYDKAIVARGEKARFETSKWPDGPYEIRASAAADDGKRDYKHVFGYKGDWIAQACQMLDECDKLPKNSNEPRVLVQEMLGQRVLDTLKLDPRKATAEQCSTGTLGVKGWAKLASTLMEDRELKAGNADGAPARGFVRLAWRDPVDDSAQFSGVYLPPEYSAAKAWPLVVNLHGHDDKNSPYIRSWHVEKRNDPMERYGVIFMEPRGRNNTGYQGIGELDVLKSVEEARRRFNIDPNRIYLMGVSMGGGGTWYMGTRHPDLFAAIGPICGGWDYHGWMDQKDFDRATKRDRYFLEADSSFAQAEALLTTPVYAHHGDSDNLVPVDFTRYAVRMLQRWDYNVRYYEHVGQGHGTLGAENQLVPWFLERQLQRNPRHVRVRSARLDSAHAHWVKITQRRDPLAFIVADARIAEDNALLLDTTNTLEIHLTPPASLFDMKRPVRVFWNSENMGTRDLINGEIILRDKTYKPKGLVKRPGIEGPIGNVDTTPFAIIRGTASQDPKMKRFCQLRAEAARDDWEIWQHVKPRYFLDTEITEEQMRSYTLLLFGGPEANLVTRRLIKSLPLSIKADKVVIDGQSFQAPDAAVKMIYPNPLNPDRYVMIAAGTSAKGMYLTKWMDDRVDFCIADGRLGDDSEGAPAGELLNIVTGSFDHNWRYDKAYSIMGDTKARSTVSLRRVPSIMDTHREAQTLMLSDVLENRSSGSFATMMRDSNWSGKPLLLDNLKYDKGIAVQAWQEPCAATYDLQKGQWKKLQARIGIELEKPAAELDENKKACTHVSFVVRGDGEQLYRSPVFTVDSKPIDIDIDISKVENLELFVENKEPWNCAAQSVDWANVRLEK